MTSTNRLAAEIEQIGEDIADVLIGEAPLRERTRELRASWSAISAAAERAGYGEVLRIAESMLDVVAGWERGAPIGPRSAEAMGRILLLTVEGASEQVERQQAWSGQIRLTLMGHMATLERPDAPTPPAERTPTPSPALPARDMVPSTPPTDTDPELLALFVGEVDGVAPRLLELVLALEAGGDVHLEGEEAMRLAHSLKGAARVVGLDGLVAALHAAEDTLTSIQRGRALGQTEAQTLLRLVDLLTELTGVAKADVGPWLGRQQALLGAIVNALLQAGGAAPGAATVTRDRVAAAPDMAAGAPPTAPLHAPAGAPADARAVRVSADSMSRLLGLAGETVVEARRLGAWARNTAALERAQARVSARASALRERARTAADPVLNTLVEQLSAEVAAVTTLLGTAQANAGQGFERLLDAGERLYFESLRARQRPFAQLLPGLRRQVRDASKSLGKDVRLEVTGAATLVDGDVLAAMEPMLGHLLVNAIDHGIEKGALRAARGKGTEGMLRIDLRHSRGQLQLVMSDDGAGIDHEQIRAAVIDRKLIDEVTARNLGRAELIEMLFLPGFSTAREVSVHSGRGVGLDAVRTDCHRLGGRIALASEFGRGSRFELILPVTRVVVRALLVVIAGETYALPLAQAGRVVRVRPSDVHNVEGRDYVELDGENIGVIRADEVLELAPQAAHDGDVTLVLLGDEGTRYGLAVDATRGEDDLVVRPLDARLGRVPDTAAAALLADGSPTLVLDIDDLMLSIDKLARRRGRTLNSATRRAGRGRQKRVLVVDDSVTVREVERQLLSEAGYLVAVAADGVEGLSMLRNGQYDLAVLDVDMPRMTGLELTRTIRADARLARLPVIIISYKETQDDRLRGLEAGADLYLAKGSFDNNQLAHAVQSLIGDA